MLQINIFVANEQTVGYCKKCYGWKKLLHINLKKVQQLDGKNKKILNLYEKFLWHVLLVEACICIIEKKSLLIPL